MDPLPFLEEILTFPDGTSYQRLEPITDFRQCHGVTPPERRILFRCRRVTSPEEPSSADESKGGESILKVKVQIPDYQSTTTANNGQTSQTPTTSIPPPSAPTSHELKALTIFRDSRTPSGPHLIAFSHVPQGSGGPLPEEGYISCTVMSKISGKSLFELGYWSLTSEEREEIQRGFLEALG
jgi:hypothetical protein